MVREAAGRRVARRALRARALKFHVLFDDHDQRFADGRRVPLRAEARRAVVRRVALREDERRVFEVGMGCSWKGLRAR
jgi:hypothetical protein